MEKAETRIRAGAGVSHRIHLDALVELWMPRGLSDPEREQRSRLVIRVTLMSIGVCLFMATRFLVKGMPALAAIALPIVPLQIVVLVMHRITRSHRLAAHAFCLSLWAMFFGIATLTGGLDSPNLIANAFLVVVAPMLLGRREGLVWLGAALTTAAVQFALTGAGFVRQVLPEQDVRTMRLFVYGASFTTVALTAFYYRRGADRMHEELARETQLVDAANRDLRIILDNSGQGFLSLDRAGRVAGEHSAVVASWFHAPVPGQSFAEFLEPLDRDVAAWFKVSWEQLEEGWVPLDLTLHQLPKQLVVGDRTFTLAYIIVNRTGEMFEKVVIIISDITAELENQRIEQRRRDILDGFEHILRDPDGFQAFFSSAQRDVAAIRSEALAPDELRRCLHTLKGNAAVLGLSALSKQCHHLEDEFEGSASLGPSSLDALEHELTLIDERLGALARRHAVGEISLHIAEYRAFLRDIREARPHHELEASVRSWTLGRVESHLSRLAEHARQVATRLQKGPLEVSAVDNGLRTPPELGEFWSVLVHVVRNAVDHGLEDVDERRRLGKPQPRIQLLASLEGGRFVVEVSDNGRGINWERVRERALELGLRADTEQALVSALFADGLSTSREVSMLSGRGVGLSSVISVCTELGARVETLSSAGGGTTFRFTFPEEALASKSASASRDATALGAVS